MVGTDSCDLAVGVKTALDRGKARALLHRVASGKSAEHTGDLLVNLRRNHASLTFLGGEQVEDRAVGEKAAVVGALIDGLLESRNVPTVDKVAVESVTSGVTLSKDERLTATVPLVVEVASVVVDLVEDGDQMDGVSVRALAAVVATTNGVGHVGHVISRIKVDTIPARREEDLGAETIGTLLVGKTVSSAGAAAVVEADKADSLGSKIVGVVTLEGVTSEHAETFGEGLELIVVGTATLKVVDSHATIDTGTVTGLVYVLERSILVLEVQSRGPVVGKILLDGARRAVRGTSIGVVHLEFEAIASGDGVNVAGNLARRDNRVGTLSNNTSRARHTEECSSRRSEGGSQAENFGRSVHGEVGYRSWN